MMNFNFFKDFGKMGKMTNKLLAYSLALVFVLFASASLNSLNAQSNLVSTHNESVELNEITVKDIIQAWTAEVAYLSDDMKKVPPTITQNDILMGSPFHRGVISAYNRGIYNLSNGGDVQKQLLSILNGPLFKDGPDSASKGLVLKAGQKQQLNNIIQFVQGWNLQDGDISDFSQALMMIRELKN